MRSMKVLFIVIAVAVIGGPGPVHASPIAEWSEPWQPFLLNEPIVGSGITKEAFGASATADGQKNDLGAAGDPLPDTDAVAKAMSRAVSNTFGTRSVAQAQVQFWRDFTLSGSPGGWDVTLSGTLVGSLGIHKDFTSSEMTMTEVNVKGYLATGGTIIIATEPTLAPPSANTLMTLFALPSETVRLDLPPGPPLPEPDHRMDQAVNLVDSVTTHVPDGSYTTLGFLYVRGGIEANLGGPGSAESLFFDSFVVSTTAVPVPEPTTGLLLCIGLAALTVSRRRSRFRLA